MDQPLEFRTDGTFTIVQFTDMHWHDGTGLDLRTASLMELVLDAERPDLVVLTGDVLEGSECPDPDTAWRQAVAPMEHRSIPWAAVFGNHDDEGSLDRHQLMAIERSCRMCISEPGPSRLPGVGNYVLEVRSGCRGVAGVESSSHQAIVGGPSGDSKTRPQPPDPRTVLAARLYFLDSLSYAADGNGYAAISREQIDWFRSAHRELDGPRISCSPIPALVFLHIPLPEFAIAGQTGKIRGSHLEGVQCPRVNSGFFAAAQSVGVLGILAGHDHLNDFDAEWHGVRLCYGRATGYRTYGREGFARGARVIRLIEGERRFETWLILDDGSSVGQFPLTR